MTGEIKIGTAFRGPAVSTRTLEVLRDRGLGL